MCQYGGVVHMYVHGAHMCVPTKCVEFYCSIYCHCVIKPKEEDNRIKQEQITMYRGNLSQDKYETQQLLADIHFESVIIEINPDTADLYNIESWQYSFSRIQYQRSVIKWLLREYGNVEVRYEILDIQIGEERYTHGHLRDLRHSNRDIADIYQDNAWYPPQVAEYSYGCLIGYRRMLHGIQITNRESE